MNLRSLFSALLPVLCSGCCLFQTANKPRSFDFALIGDVPYTAEAATNQLPHLMAQLNAADIEFIVHDGDIKAGGTLCSNELYEARLHDFQSSQHPFIYVFGDNEWTDCLRYDPQERLNKLRELFTQGDRSLGREKLPLARQSNDPRHAAFRENVRWEMGGVMFVTLNVPGMINNYGKPGFAERNAANLAWLRDSFAFAKVQNTRALMFIFQANPFPEIGSTNKLHTGFKEMISALTEETLSFARPVVLVHGDTHYFRVDKPLYSPRTNRRIENFTRVETFGYPDVHWIRVTVDPQDPEVFTFRPQMVRTNFVNHRKN